jgi:hypothetical protein
LSCCFAHHPHVRRRAVATARRVEHLVSGEVIRFRSLEALLAFMRRVLNEVEHDER